MDDCLLVIDNDPGIVELVAFFFEQEGYRVHTARDGVEGIALARAHRPHVVICDILMEHMHGFEVLTSLRGLPELARTVVVIASAKYYQPDIDRARELGAD